MKGKSIIDAVLVFTALQIVLIVPVGVRDLIRWETRQLGGSYLTGILMVALPVFLILFRHYEFRFMGTSIENWRRSVNTGFRGWLFFIVPQLLLTFFMTWDIRIRDNWRVGVFMAVIVLVACYLFSRDEEGSASDRRLLVMGLILLFPIGFSLSIGTFSLRLVKEYIWNIAVGGFAEEFLYRGYIQSSVNQEYGTQWSLGKVKFGYGLLVSSALYGVGFGLTALKPWIGVIDFAWGSAVYGFALGLFFGLIREAGGDILASGTSNSLIKGVGEALVRALS